MGIKQLYNEHLRKLPNEYGDVSVMVSRPSKVSMAQVWMLSDEWLLWYTLWETLTQNFDEHTNGRANGQKERQKLYTPRHKCRGIKIHYFNFFPNKRLGYQIWPCRKIDQWQRRVIIWTNLVVLEHPILHTKCQCHRPFGSREDDFLSFLPYMVMAAIMVMWPGPIEQTFVPPSIGGSTLKFYFNRLGRF